MYTAGISEIRDILEQNAQTGGRKMAKLALFPKQATWHVRISSEIKYLVKVEN